jgi:methionyl-tRNA synthetase
MDYISIDEFKKVEIRIGEITSAEPVDGSEKLLRLMVNFGDEDRQVVSGIAKFFPDHASLVGKRCAFATNLEPRKLMGLESQAMILACGGDPIVDAEGTETGEYGPLYLFESSAPAGSRAR